MNNKKTRPGRRMDSEAERLEKEESRRWALMALSDEDAGLIEAVAPQACRPRRLSGLVKRVRNRGFGRRRAA